jgi:hypothetical protein
MALRAKREVMTVPFSRPEDTWGSSQRIFEYVYAYGTWAVRGMVRVVGRGQGYRRCTFWDNSLLG